MAPYATKTHSQRMKELKTLKIPENRLSAKDRGYNEQWRKARKHYLKHHPLCVYCLRQGRTTAANVVDHIVPHKGDMLLFWDINNWQALCSVCHDSAKRREERT